MTQFTSVKPSNGLFTNKNYKVSKTRLAAVSSAVALGCVSPVSAEDIRLMSTDRSVNISGQLLSFEDNVYRIETIFGPLEISANDVTCEGLACPLIANDDFTIRLASSPDFANSVVPDLIEAFGRSLDATLDTNAQNGSDVVLGLEESDQSDLAFQITNEIEDLQPDSTDFAFTSQNLGEGNLEGTSTSVFALDGLVVITSPENPVRSITLEQAKRIFAGEITNWREIGGRDQDITVYVVPEDTAETEFFLDRVMNAPGQSFPDGFLRVGDPQKLSDFVVGDPTAIGFASLRNQGTSRALAIRGSCGIQTVANSFTIKTEEYPLTRRIFGYTNANNTQPITASFDAFLQSNEAQEVLAGAGFVDQRVSSVPVDEQGLRLMSSVLPEDAEVTLDQLQDMIRELVVAERLSITFRFDTGSSKLDTKAETDVARLAEQILSGRFDNQEILLLGFTDSVGRGDLNQVLSQARATQVMNEVLSRLPREVASEVNVNVVGYGEMMPLACNETVLGREINRRVEVWTRDILR